MKLLNTLLLSIPLSCCSVAPAFADKLYLGQLTRHISKSQNITNESHELLIYEHSSGWGGGYFKNSYDRDTFIFGKSFALAKNHVGEVGV